MERVLEASKLIEKAGVETMQILQSFCVAHINTINRNSKSIKDPDPLSSMMSNISLKYPITVETSAIEKFKIPDDLVMKQNDLRKYGRTPCKLDLISWYLNMEYDMDKDTEEIIDGLMTPGTMKLDKILNMEWRGLTYSVGRTQFTRRMIATNPLEIKIPRELKVPLLSKVLNIESYIEYTKVPQDMVEFVKEKLLKNNTIPYRSLPNIIQFLDNTLNERRRFLPIIPGMNEEFLLVSHVLMQPTFSANEIGQFVSKVHRENTIISQVCINLLHYGQKYNMSSIRRFAQNIGIGGVAFTSFFDGVYENKYIRFIKGYLGYQTTCRIEYSSTQFNPEPSNVRQETHFNNAGIRYTLFMGYEKVFFQNSGIKGYFVHNGNVIIDLKINFCPFTIIETVIPHIAVYCCMNFNTDRSKTYKQMQDNTNIFWSRNIHVFLGLNKVAYEKKKREYSMMGQSFRMSFLEVMEGIDFQERLYSNLLFLNNALLTQGGQKIMDMPRVTEYSAWDESVQTQIEELTMYHQPLKILRLVIRKMYASHTYIRTNIANGIWYQDKDLISKHIIFRQRKGVSYIARELCQKYASSASCNVMKMCAFYVFTAGPIAKSEMTRFKFHTSEIYFNLSEGDLQFRMLDDKYDGLYLQNKMVLIDSLGYEYNEHVTVGRAKDYELIAIRSLEKDVPHKPFTWIDSNISKFPDGTKFTTNLGGQNYLVTKNSFFPIEMHRTIERCTIKLEETQINKEMQVFVANKRKIDEESIIDETESKAKRAKYSSSLSS